SDPRNQFKLHKPKGFRRSNRKPFFLEKCTCSENCHAEGTEICDANWLGVAALPECQCYLTAEHFEHFELPFFQCPAGRKGTFDSRGSMSYSERIRHPSGAFAVKSAISASKTLLLFRKKERSAVRLLAPRGCYRESTDVQSRVLPRHSADPPPACADRY